jgi:hypothetical protein
MSYNAKEHDDDRADPNPTTIHERVPARTNLDFLDPIAREDVEGLKKAQKSYGDSWKQRGGVGAFMMLARKWDRLENALRPLNEGAAQGCARIVGNTTTPCAAYDILRAAEIDTRAEGLIDDIRDLRRYLLLVESELRARGTIHGTHRDNK